MDSIAQKVINAVQRDEIDGEVQAYIDNANDFLLKNGEKPEFYDEFIEITKKYLIATINGCVRLRNDEKKKDDLKKYKEGYFNEIIQNANDTVGKIDKKNPRLTVCVSKPEEYEYKVTCTYPDKGFGLLNIYGFCTRGNSDKRSENGQEGMYGIGIKSLLCFVDQLEIHSNISIKVQSSKEDKILDIVDIGKPDGTRKDLQTELSFTFTYYKDKKENKHAGFNIGKMAKFIDQVYEGNCQDFKSFFFDGKDDEMVFDARSLFFTELRGNRTEENSIKCIDIKKADNEQPVLVLESKEESVGLVISEYPGIKIKIAEIEGQYKYLIFHYDDEQISIAFEYDQKRKQEELKDRLYATYFIGTYENAIPLLGERTGCLVNTTKINSSRSGFERENEKEPEILKSIMQKGKKSVEIFCKLISKGSWNDKNKIMYLDVLSWLMWIYRNSDSPKYIFENNFRCIEKSVGSWQFDRGYQYILKEEDDIKEEGGMKKVAVNQPNDSDDANICELFRVYQEYFLKKDIVLYRSEDYKQFTSGIRNLGSAIFEELEEQETWINDIERLPFLKGIKDVIERRMGGSEFPAIQKYLYPESGKVEESDRILIKQLIARYGVNDCFDYMGNYSDENIRNWLFGCESKDPEYKEKVKEYEDAYKELKDFVEVGQTKYYEYNNYRSYSRIINMSFPDPHIESTCDDIILQLLSLIGSKKIYMGVLFGDGAKLFVHNYWGGNIKAKKECPGDRWKEKELRYFGLDVLKHAMTSFDKFKIARNFADEYIHSLETPQREKWDRCVEEHFKSEYVEECNIQEIKLSEVTEIFKWLAVYKHINDNDIKINIDRITELEGQAPTSSSLIDFVKWFLHDEYKHVFIKNDTFSVDNNGRNFIGFVTNLNKKPGIYVKLSANDDFKQLGEIKDVKEEKFLLIYSTKHEHEQEVFKEVFKELGEELASDKDSYSYISNFIKTGNTRFFSLALYSGFLKRRKLEYQYPFEYNEIAPDSKGDMRSLSMEETYDLLMGEMSYDDHCPICNAMPTRRLNNNKNDSKLVKRNCRVAIFQASYHGKDIYVKIVCCKDCFKEYKDSLTQAEIMDIKGEDGSEAAYKKMILKNTISTTAMSRDMENEVLLSPDNWKIIRQFNKDIFGNDPGC